MTYKVPSGAKPTGARAAAPVEVVQRLEIVLDRGRQRRPAAGVEPPRARMAGRFQRFVGAADGVQAHQVDQVFTGVAPELDGHDVDPVGILCAGLAEHIGIPGQLFALDRVLGDEIVAHLHQLPRHAAVRVHGKQPRREVFPARRRMLVARIVEQALVVHPLEAADVVVGKRSHDLDGQVGQVDHAELVVAVPVIHPHREALAVGRQPGAAQTGMVEEGGDGNRRIGRQGRDGRP
jgi:hypothetical protein